MSSPVLVLSCAGLVFARSSFVTPWVLVVRHNRV